MTSNGADLILGTSCLATLGPHIADYNKLSIQFVLDNKLVTLHGDRTLKPHLATMHQLNRLISAKAIEACFTISISEISPSGGSCGHLVAKNFAVHLAQLQFPEDMPVALQHLLLKYHHIFNVPSGLPSSRAFDHAILLVSKTAPIKIKPYRIAKKMKLKVW